MVEEKKAQKTQEDESTQMIQRQSNKKKTDPFHWKLISDFCTHKKRKKKISAAAANAKHQNDSLYVF
jgi:predicted Zn-dependent protease